MHELPAPAERFRVEVATTDSSECQLTTGSSECQLSIPLCWERASGGKALNGTARMKEGQLDRWARTLAGGARRTHGAGRGPSWTEVHHAAAAGAVAAAGACHSEGPAVDRPPRLPPSTCRRLVGKSAAVQMRDRLLPHVQHACRSQSSAPFEGNFAKHPQGTLWDATMRNDLVHASSSRCAVTARVCEAPLDRPWDRRARVMHTTATVYNATTPRLRPRQRSATGRTRPAVGKHKAGAAAVGRVQRQRPQRPRREARLRRQARQRGQQRPQRRALQQRLAGRAGGSEAQRRGTASPQVPRQHLRKRVRFACCPIPYLQPLSTMIKGETSALFV